MKTPFQPRVIPSESESRKRAKMKLCDYKSIRFFIGIITPFALMPLALSQYKEARCGYVMLWMIIYWVFEPVHIAVTALLPVPLMPLLGILDSTQVTLDYMKEVLMMFLGGLGVAVAVEHCNLHKRIALKVLLTLGTDRMWLMFGFMSTSMFLSMWISNSATTAMMVPIIDAVMGELQNKDNVEDGDENKFGSVEDLQRLHKALLLGVAYSANFGGTGTLTGTSPNMLLKGYLDSEFPGSHEITYASWMAYCIPSMVLGTIAAWIILQVLFVPCWQRQDEETKERIRCVISAKYEEIGSITFHEAAVLVLFILLVLLWVFRQPEFMPGWADLLNSGKVIGDAVPAILILVLMFIVPAEPWLIPRSAPLVKWNVMQQKIPWGLVILLGGGYAMSHGAKASGLSDWMSQKMFVLSVLSPMAVLFIVFIIVASVTEVMSNSATTAVFLPIAIQMAHSFRLNPLYLMLPLTLVASYAFMLPVATGPTAIIFGTGHLKTIDMIKAGIILKIIGCLIQFLTIHTLGDHMFHFYAFPQWANTTERPPPVDRTPNS